MSVEHDTPPLPQNLQAPYQAIYQEAQAAFNAAEHLHELDQAKSKYFGKQGSLTELMKGLSQLPPEEKKSQGALINQLKQGIESVLKDRKQSIENALLTAQLAKESIDVSLPGRGEYTGSVHPVMQTWERVEAIFRSIGFDVADGPEIENDWYNFSALNSPENHPARSMQDTFYVDAMEGEKPFLLRTHTSPMQVRYAQKRVKEGKLPIKVIAPGRTYRVDLDATHSPMFHQVEGLWIADIRTDAVSLAALKGVYTHFLRAFFETDDLQFRFRPSYFPFTEPSAEIDVLFPTGPLKGKWLEVSGSGQVHATVIKNFGLDPEHYVGFAFGSGLERLTMLRYGVSDLRAFFEGDVRFLRQF
jgi:phenylalanyl-tRNA synthetase alpha chain